MFHHCQQLYRWYCSKVAQWLVSQSRNLAVMGQVVQMHVSVSPSSVIWYWPRGSDTVAVAYRALCSFSASAHLADLWMYSKPA